MGPKGRWMVLLLVVITSIKCTDSSAHESTPPHLCILRIFNQTKQTLFSNSAQKTTPIQLVFVYNLQSINFDIFHQFLLLYEKLCVQFLSSRATERTKILQPSELPSGE